MNARRRGGEQVIDEEDQEYRGVTENGIFQLRNIALFFLLTVMEMF